MFFKIAYVYIKTKRVRSLYRTGLCLNERKKNYEKLGFEGFIHW